MLIVVHFPFKENIEAKIDRVRLEMLMKELGYAITSIEADELERIVEFMKVP